jgi:hypothetical protein
LTWRASDFLSDLVAYLRAVFAEGWAWVSLLFDVLGIVAWFRPGLGGLVEARRVVKAIGGGIFLLSFVLANFFAYRKQRHQIRELEGDIDELGIEEADIYLKDEYHAEVCWPSLTPISGHGRPFPLVKVIRGGYREDGVPGWASICARLDAENRGPEDGCLVCEFDTDASRFPRVFDRDFHVVSDSDPVFRDSEHKDKIPKRDHRRRYFHLAVLVSEQDPKAFAHALASLGDYCIRLRYYSHPKVGDSVRGPRYLDVEGDFDEFRQETLSRWRRHGKFKHLAEIAEGHINSRGLEPG